MWNEFSRRRPDLKNFFQPPTKSFAGQTFLCLEKFENFFIFFPCWVTERIANWPVTGSLKGPWSCPSGGPWISIRPCGRNLYSSVRSVSSLAAKPTATKKKKKKENGESRNRIISCRSSADGGCASATISDALWFSYSPWLCSNISGSPSRRNSPIIQTQIISRRQTTGSLSYLIRFQWPSIRAPSPAPEFNNSLCVCVCLFVLVCVEKEENKHWDNQRECVRGQCVCVCDSPYLCLGIGYRETSFFYLICLSKLNSEVVRLWASSVSCQFRVSAFDYFDCLKFEKRFGLGRVIGDHQCGLILVPGQVNNFIPSQLMSL